MVLTKELAIYLDKLLKINDIYSSKLKEGHNSVGAQFSTGETNIFINISDGKVKLELEDGGSTVSTVSGNRMKVLKDNEGDTFVNQEKIPSTEMYFSQAQKLSEFISVEEYEVVISKLVDFANDSTKSRIADNNIVDIEKIDNVFDPKLEEVLKNLSWYKGYDLDSYLTLLDKRSWEINFFKHAKEKMFFPVIPTPFAVVFGIGIGIIMLSEEMFFYYGLGSISFFLIYEFFLFKKCKFCRKVSEMSEEQGFSVRSVKDILSINEIKIGGLTNLIFSDYLLEKMKFWINDRKYKYKWSAFNGDYKPSYEQLQRYYSL